MTSSNDFSEWNQDVGPHGQRDGQTGHETDTYDDQSPFLNPGSSPSSVRDLHQQSDIDSSTFAQHHTLGPRHNQASPGDHIHDGVSSKVLSSLGAWVPISAQAMWTSGASPQPAINSASSYAAYYKNGTYVTVKWSINPNGTTTFGTGDWVFLLPFPAAHFIGWHVVGIMNGTVTTSYMSSAAVLVTASAVKIINQGTAGFWGVTTPVTWDSSGYVSLEFTYESTS